MGHKFKKLTSCQDMIKSIDIFGTSVDFSFKNSPTFATWGGFTVSIIIVFFMLIYSIILIWDSVLFSKPFTITSFSPMDLDIDKYTITPSAFPKEFGDNPIKEDNSFSSNTTFNMQFSFALFNRDKNQIIPYDPRYLIVNGYTVDFVNNKNFLVYFQNCEKFLYSSNLTFDNLLLQNTYCIFSDFELYDTYPSVSGRYKGFSLMIKKCKNDTYSIVKKESHPAYKRLVQKYKDLVNNTNTTLQNKTLNRETSKVSLGINVKENANKIFEENLGSEKTENINIDNNYLYQTSGLANNTDSLFMNDNTHILHNSIIAGLGIKDYTPLVCRDSSTIDQTISRVKLIFYLNNFFYNSTISENGVIAKVENRDCYLSKTLSKEKVFYFTHVTVKTQNSLIPQSLSDNPTIKHFLNFENENNIYGDNVENSSISAPVYNVGGNEYIDSNNENLSYLIIALNNYKKTLTRRYQDVFEIMGNIGGLSKVLTMLGFCLVFYYVNFRKKEALMNELYVNKSLRDNKDYKEKIIRKLEESDQSLIKKIYNYCKTKYEIDGLAMEEKYVKNFENHKMNEINENENKQKEENKEIYIDYSPDALLEDIQTINSLYKSIFISFCDDINEEIVEIWKEQDNNREKEFHNRIFCRAFVKYFFVNKANYLINNEEFFKINDNTKYALNGDYNNNEKKSINIETLFLSDFQNKKNDKEDFIAHIINNYVNELELENYLHLSDNIYKESGGKFSFNIFEIIFMITCRRCSSLKFQKRCKDFENKYDEFLEQTDFSQIINSIHEFKIFKKCLFEKGQLLMFDSYPSKPIFEENDKNINNIPEDSKTKEGSLFIF